MSTSAHRFGDASAGEICLRERRLRIAGPGIVDTRSVVAGTGGAPEEILDGDSRRRSAGGGVPNPAQRGNSQTRRSMLISGPFVEFSCASGPVQLTQSQAACGAMGLRGHLSGVSFGRGLSTSTPPRRFHAWQASEGTISTPRARVTGLVLVVIVRINRRVLY